MKIHSDTQTVTIHLGRPLRQLVQLLAEEQDISAGQFIRTAVAKEIARVKNAKPPVRADEQLVAPLRARLAKHFAQCTSWSALQHVLQTDGYSLHAAGGGLALHSYPGGQRICKASELGFSYSRLMRRLNAPFPGHTHTWVANKMLATPPAPDDADDVDVIERF